MGFLDRLLGRHPDDRRTSLDATDPTDNAASSGAPDLTDAEREESTARITQLQQLLAQGEDADESPNWQLYEELGILHERLGDLDAAITAHETALAEHTRYGESYNQLMTLYNTKLAQSSAAGDGEAINHWMSKIDELLATSKRIMRENY